MRTLILILLIFFSGSLIAQKLSVKDEALISKHITDFDVTANDTAAVWNSTNWVNLVNRKGSSSYNTKIKTLYSDTGIYFLFSCEDGKISATLTEDFANLFREDIVEVFIWPDETQPIYLEYELSPLNYEVAILVPNLDGRMYGWQPWHYEGKRKTKHATKILKDENENIVQWTAEVFIPYALLQPLGNVPPSKGKQWRINLYRIDYDNDTSYWSWKPFEKNFHDFQHYGVLRFE